MNTPTPRKFPVKPLHLCLLPLLVLCASTIAQSDSTRPDSHHRGKGWGPPDPERHVARLTEELELNDEQAAELLEVFKAAETERENLRAQHEADMCALIEGVDAQVRGVLTAEQQAELDELHANMKARLEERMENKEGRRHGKRGKGFPDCDKAKG